MPVICQADTLWGKMLASSQHAKTVGLKLSARLAVLVAAGFLFLLMPGVDAQQAGTITGTATITGTDFTVHVQVFSDGTLVAETTTDASGTYVVTGLPAGTYFVRFHDPVYSSFPGGFYGTSTRVNPMGSPVVVVGGSTTSGIDFTYTETSFGWIEGRAYDAITGVPACVQVFAGGGGPRTEADGTYRLTLAPGSYTVQFQDNCLFDYVVDQWWDRANSAASADIIDLAVGEAVQNIDGPMVRRCAGVDSADSNGLVDPVTGKWWLMDCVNASVSSFYYGNPADVPFMGDWDCDGLATPGLFRPSDALAYLRNSNTQGIADISFFFGNPSDVPLAGDFNGDGCDTLSIYRPSQARFYIINTLGEDGGALGAAEYSFLFGNLGDRPVVGDWDGDGVDEIGLHRETAGLFYWRNTLDTGVADGSIIFGNPGDRFVAGDWGVVDGVDTPAVHRWTSHYFRHTLTSGNADSQMEFGKPGWIPVAGDFGFD